jgi:hypothetical protein
MRRCFILALLLSLFVACAWGAGKSNPTLKGAEVKHFTGSEGVELTAEFYDFLYASMKSELAKTKLFNNIIGEDETVDAADASQTVLIEGTVLEYKKGSAVKERLIGFGMGSRSLISHIKVSRIGDKQVLADKDIKVKAMQRWDNKMLAKELAKRITKECKNSLKK